MPSSPNRQATAEPQLETGAEPVAGTAVARSSRMSRVLPGGMAYLARQGLSRGSLIVIWLVMIVVFWLTLGNQFMQGGTFKTIFSSPVYLVFPALALVISFFVGEFDLSIASVLGISGTTLSVLTVRAGFNPWVASVVAVAVAVVVGLVNGVLIVRLGVNAIVVTLGMATALTGVALWVTNMNTISGLPASFSDAFNHPVGGIAVSFFYALALTVLVAYVLTSTPLGLRMSFVGENREVSRLTGIRVSRIRLGSYVVSALVSGIGGIVLGASLGGFDPASSPNYLLPAIAAAFLGTAVIQPGKFNAPGAFIGIFFLQTGIVGLQLAGLTGFIQDLFYGVTLVIAVTVSTLVRRRADA